jgi:hypothetical protein
MAVTTITKVGSFSDDVATQINDNFAAVGSGGSFASPAITGTVSGGATYTAPTLSAPVFASAYTFAGTPTLTQTAIFSNNKVLAASATSATNVAATLTGFSWTVVAGAYQFELNLPATMTTNAGLTIDFLLTTAVLTSIQYQTYAATASDNTTAVSTQGTTATSATKVFDSATAAYTLVNIKGSMVVGTGGTFAWQFAQHTTNSDTTTVLLGAYATMQRVA